MSPTTLIDFRTLRADLQAAVSEGDRASAQTVADELHRQVMEAMNRGDRSRLAKLGGQTARLQRIAQDGQDERLDADLRRIARTVEIAWTAEAMQGSRQEPTVPEKFTVQELVLSQLQDGPKRPRDIAEELHVDRTQVSRALRKLKQAGRVSHVDASAPGADQRASLWMAA